MVLAFDVVFCRWFCFCKLSFRSWCISIQLRTSQQTKCPTSHNTQKGPERPCWGQQRISPVHAPANYASWAFWMASRQSFSHWAARIKFSPLSFFGFFFSHRPVPSWCCQAACSFIDEPWIQRAIQRSISPAPQCMSPLRRWLWKRAQAAGGNRSTKMILRLQGQAPHNYFSL